MKKPSPTLKEQWAEKLKKSGFEDIEQDEFYFKTGSKGVIDPRRVTWESQAEYYQLSRYFLNDYTFQSERELIVWEYHTNGISIRDIAETLKKVGVKKFGRKPVREMIKRLENIMKKMYGVTK